MSRPARARVVLLHGVGLDRHVWDPLIERLDPQRFDVHAVDLLGHGQSAPAPQDITLAELAEAVVPVLEPGAHLVGFSLGALVAQHLAIHRPELVATLSCVSCVCERTPVERKAVLARLDAAQADFAGGVSASLRRWYGGTGVSEAVVDQTRHTLLANDVDSYLHCYRVFATADAHVAPQLPAITAPTLAITGSDDPGSTPAMSHRLGAAIPHCRVVVLQDTRHMLPVQRPAELASALTQHIAQNCAPRSTT